MKKLILLALTLVSYNSFAWGPVAHRATGLIADAHLNPQAQAAVRTLLGSSSLGDIANWADQARSSGQYRQTVWYHFEKLPDGVSYLENLKALPDWQRQKGGVVMAILEANRVLRSSVFPASLRTDALKFLVHFIGDLHQPLHSGRPEDNGGVKTDVTWMGTAMNLHRIWDSGMIQTGHADVMRGSDDGRAYAAFLMNSLAQENIALALDTETWLNESLALRTPAYEKIYETDQTRYQQLHLREADLRVYSAGLRIAANLNAIFANEAMPASQTELITKIEALTGPLDKLITFTP